MTAGRYPLRIRFWYLVHDKAERLWHWVYREKIGPWHQADRASRPQVPPDYKLVQTIPATDEQRATGMTATKIYVRRDDQPAPDTQSLGEYRYTVNFVNAKGETVSSRGDQITYTDEP